MRPCPPLLPALLLAAALAPAPSRAAAPAPADLAGQPVGKGAVVTVDLSRLPSTVEVRGQARCAGGRITATGDREPLRCQRPFRFDAPLKGEPVVLLFQPKAGGAPTRLEYPLERDPRPRTFTAPAEGTVSQPPAKPPAALPAMPAEVAAKARAAAAESCGECPKEGGFTLEGYALEKSPPPALEVGFTIQPAP